MTGKDVLRRAAILPLKVVTLGLFYVAGFIILKANGDLKR